MKNKKTAQVAAKRLHRKGLETAKAKRGQEPVLERPVPGRDEKPSILIVCEGKNTEPSYFRQFRLSSASIKAVGHGYNTVSLVDRAVQLSGLHHYDQVWCVFDKDLFLAVDFNQAIVSAAANNFGVAYSNQAFEYWLLLHFNDHQGGAMDRTTYGQKINEYINPLGAEYQAEGNKIVTEDFFEILNGVDEITNQRRIRLAIARAKRNYNNFLHESPAEEESSTTVFKLIEEILRFI